MGNLTSDQIAFLALILSLISILINIVNAYNDKHKLKLTGAIFESPKKRNAWNLSITASNKGKRPISVSFVIVRPKLGNTYSMKYDENKHPVQILPGSSASTDINKEWQTIEELRACKIYVQDAVGKNHRLKL